MNDLYTDEQIEEIRQALISDEGMEHFYKWEKALELLNKLCDQAKYANKLTLTLQANS